MIAFAVVGLIASFLTVGVATAYLAVMIERWINRRIGDQRMAVIVWTSGAKAGTKEVVPIAPAFTGSIFWGYGKLVSDEGKILCFGDECLGAEGKFNGTDGGGVWDYRDKVGYWKPLAAW